MPTTRFALLQTSLTGPSPEVLSRVFSQVPGLTGVDAHLVANDAYGILLRHRRRDEALALQGRLRREGIETELVAEPDLPVLPATKFLRQVDCLPEALIVYDALGRGFPVDWKHVWLIAAGTATVIDFVPITTTKRVDSGLDEDGIATASVVKETHTKEKRLSKLMLEVILGRGVARYSTSADKLRYNYLGDRRTASLPANFITVVRDMMGFAPHAWLNRGAQGVKESPDHLFIYPTKNAFLEEITWLLWQMTRAGREDTGTRS